jgi:hypothetical protein
VAAQAEEQFTQLLMDRIGRASIVQDHLAMIVPRLGEDEALDIARVVAGCTEGRIVGPADRGPAAGFGICQGATLAHQHLGHGEILHPGKAHRHARSNTKASWARGVCASHHAASKAARHACACSTGTGV